MSATMLSAVAVIGLLVTPAFASTGPATGNDRVAAVQAVLDRVLGPGNAVVTIADTIQTSVSATSSVQWGASVPVSVSAGQLVVTGAGSTGTSAVQNAVGSTVTTTVTPAGSLVRQSVSVAINKASLGANSIAAVRRLITAAAGIVPARGDRISIVVATFAHRAAVVAPVVTPWTLLLQHGEQLVWIGGGVLALLLLLLMTRRRRPRATTVRA